LRFSSILFKRARVNRRVLAACVVALVSLTACGDRSDAASAKRPGCVAAPAGIGPDAKATLQLADAGKTVCLHHGDVLTVFLAAPPDEAMWTPIHTSSRRVVEPRSAGVLTLVRGVTGAVFRADARGIATLTSTRPPCTRQTIRSCDSAHEWRARVEIKR